MAGSSTTGTCRTAVRPGSIVLNQPVVGIADTADAGGYWPVASDGGVFALAMPIPRLDGWPAPQRARSWAWPTPATGGYWEVASDGGSSPSMRPFLRLDGWPAPEQADRGHRRGPATGGYWEVASDGGIFAFDAPFLRVDGWRASQQAHRGHPEAGTGGYWEVASDGGSSPSMRRSTGRWVAASQPAHRRNGRNADRGRLLGGRLRRGNLRLRCPVPRLDGG